jgi:hypothetical protein
MSSASGDFRDLARSVSNTNFARMLVVQAFLNAIKDTKLLDNSAEPKRISVVGGSPDEPEIQALRRLGLQLDIRVFGVDSTSEYLD